MARMRERKVDITLAAGEEIRIADAPSSEPLKNMSISLVPLYDGPSIPAGGVNVAWEVYYGGGYDKPARVYAAPAPAVDPYQGGISQGSGTLAAGALSLPVALYNDVNLLNSDRYRDGWRVRENAGAARALHLYNTTAGTLGCRVIFLSEAVGEAI
ncbi:MAG: hypothetical protein DRP01_02100 [Archaeoglobales archaeon]|nr:MAG: hypothetical protein DRP01_02100 [Archaeoglobales archaeon]